MMTIDMNKNTVIVIIILHYGPFVFSDLNMHGALCTYFSIEITKGLSYE